MGKGYSAREKGKWIKEHRQEIIESYLKDGASVTIGKFNISSYTVAKIARESGILGRSGTGLNSDNKVTPASIADAIINKCIAMDVAKAAAETENITLRGQVVTLQQEVEKLKLIIQSADTKRNIEFQEKLSRVVATSGD